MINILCFGDSNTNGTNPAGGRWPRDKRWPGILQRLLGEDYYVIEEGCGGRTTVFEDCLELDKNGRTQLRVALRLGTTEGIKSFVRHSDAMAILSVISVVEELRRGTLRIIDIEGLTLTRDFSFVHLAAEPVPLARRFEEFARAEH